jgi:hypothetical protein
MAVNIVYLGGAGDAVDRTEYTFADLPAGTNASGDFFVAVVTAAGSNPKRLIDAVTIDGVTATLRRTSAQSGEMNSVIDIWQAPATGPQTDSLVTVVATYTAGAQRSGVELYRVSDADPIPHAVTSLNEGTNANNSNFKVSLDAPADGGVIAGAYQGNTSAGTWSWTGVTIDADRNLEGNRSSTSAHDEFASAQTPLEVNPTFTSQGSRNVIVAASWGPASSGIDVEVGLSSEVTEAFEVGGLKTAHLGLSQEESTALALTVLKTVHIGLAEAENLAQSLSWSRTVQVSLALEESQGLGIEALFEGFVEIGLAEETAQALAIGVLKTLHVGLALEENQGLGLGTITKTRFVDIAVEQNLAQAIEGQQEDGTAETLRRLFLKRRRRS